MEGFSWQPIAAQIPLVCLFAWFVLHLLKIQREEREGDRKVFIGQLQAIEDTRRGDVEKLSSVISGLDSTLRSFIERFSHQGM